MRLVEIGVIGMIGLGLVAMLTLRTSRGIASSPTGLTGKTGDADQPTYSASGFDVSPLDKDRVNRLAGDLNAAERNILLNEGTERAFSGAWVDNKATGIYTCRLCGLPLFASAAKFKSGTGWPSFYTAVDAEHINYVEDGKLGVSRTEIECQRCRGHLGHVFKDGPQPTGQRYCVNSASLRFFAAGADLPAASKPAPIETAYFAGGCFWGIEDRFQQVPGVIDAVSGYQGGQASDPTYREVCRGTTGHAETVQVRFDSQRVTFRELLDWFFRFHDPTQLNRQGPDFGTQYRSAIFAADDAQLASARAFIAEVQKSPRYKDRNIVTQVAKATPFHAAEDYHQDYHAKHGGSCALPSR